METAHSHQKIVEERVLMAIAGDSPDATGWRSWSDFALARRDRLRRLPERNDGASGDHQGTADVGRQGRE